MDLESIIYGKELLLFHQLWQKRIYSWFPGVGIDTALGGTGKMGERKSMTAFPSMFAKLSTFILKKCLLSDFILFGSLPYLTAFEAFTALLPVEISPSLFISLPSINHTRRLLRRSRLFSGEDGTHFSPLCSATCERCILLFVIWVNFSWGIICTTIFVHTGACCIK